MRKTVDSGIYLLIGLLLVGLAGGSAFATDNIDPSDNGAQYAWGENTGWLNAEPGGDGGPGVFVEDDGVSGYLWSENTGWVSLSCLNNATCGTRDYGVSNDSNGNLAGYAWSENAGWISFSCSNTNACATKNYGVTIDPATGEFSGRAWSENTGWISFRNQSGGVTYGVSTSWPGGGGGPACMVATDADLNDDGIVNILDVSQVGSCFGQDPGAIAQCQVADTNCDDMINMTDINFIVGSFGQTVP